MSSLSYLYKQTAKNRIKKALKRPVTYIAIVFIVFYTVLILGSLGVMAGQFGINTRQGMATILSVIMFMMIPANIISYIKRKGLIFRPSEVHFVFSAPENPKRIILFAGIKEFILQIMIGVILFLLSVIYFDVPIGKMVLYFLFMVILENVLEACIMILCYGNEKMSDRFFRVLTWLSYAAMAVFVLAGVFLLATQGTKFSVISVYLNSPVIQMIPLFGWEVAIIHLIMVGPTVINVIAALLYTVLLVVLVAAAVKMHCSGEYFEDAAKFADDYAMRMKKSKKGEMPVTKKKKYLKNVAFEYKGVYAKAIYYRQLLEYKKNRLFIFGWNSFLFFGIGVILAVIGYFNDFSGEPAKIFIIPGVIAYLVFIFSGYVTKWAKELANPYTYMIPDSSLKKLWYATKIEHIRAVVDGCLITVPAAVMLKIPPLYTVLTILLYVCLNANKLYMNMLSDALIGKMFGDTGKSVLRMLFQGFALLFAVAAALALGLMISVPAGFGGMIAATILLTFAGAAGASCTFDKMEAVE